jgi:hypothetical protein
VALASECADVQLWFTRVQLAAVWQVGWRVVEF